MSVPVPSHTLRLCPSAAALRALETLNAAWQLWPSNSNRSRRCDQWEYIQCNAQGFIVVVAPPFIENNVTMPLNVFSAMPYLRRLVLSEVYKIQGPISDLPLPPSLRVLDLLGTGVSGSLPSSILSLSALAYLDIGYTSLSGSLPSSLTRLSRLTYLNIGAMSIIGRLQDLSWLSSLTNLRSLVLDRMASVEGDLSSFTFLTALTNMQSLSMGTNGHWTGDLPVLLGSLTSLTYLDLSGLASAQFPRWVMDLTALRFLDVTHDNDYRTGVVPQDLYRLRQLEHFDASGNGLVGSLPEYWTALNHLTFLSFGSNKIEGSIPLTFSALTSLSTLNLRLNSMDGTIPRVFSTALSSLDLRTNAFSGPIPPFLGSLTGLTSMDLSGNNFTGTIPESLTGLTNMFDMLLFNNQLTSGLDVVERMTWLGTL
ncbi:unnamed protein product [Closterium sp. NIES-64]|nr:unnamed protein product [Closterium sp. NIES-64]